MVKSDIKHNSMKVIGNRPGEMECAGISMNVAGRETNIIGIYKRPGGTNRPGIWKNIVEKNKTGNNCEMIIPGDFNAHNRAWNCDMTDNNGTKLEEEMEEKEMFIINVDSKSRIGEGANRDSNIDLLFATKNIADKINYTQNDDAWESDHFPIVFTINGAPQTYIKKTNRCSTKRTEWDEYSEIMENSIDKLKEDRYNRETVEGKYQIIVDTIIKSVNIATGRKDINLQVTKATQRVTSLQQVKEEDHKTRNGGMQNARR